MSLSSLSLRLKNIIPGEASFRSFLRSAPGAVSDTKNLTHQVRAFVPGDSQLQALARRLADRRASAEGQEGLAAFLEKRPAAWIEKI